MKHAKPTLMISLCGTSLLTNLADNSERTWLLKNTNKTVNEIEDKDRMNAIIEKACKQLMQSNFQDVCKHSAELNAISRYYEMGQTINGQDIHILLASDTCVGQQTAGLVKDWLRQHFKDVRVKKQDDMTTGNLLQFHSAMSTLVKYVAKEVEPYRDSNYHVVFNLTGGFKSVQGFLQTLAMFYADEAIYIFQSQEELLRLPRLPVKMDAEGMIKNNLKTFRQLGKDLPINAEQLDGVSEVLYLQMDGEFSLSAWGELVWKQVRKELYKEKLFESPDDRIKYSDSFKKSVRDLPSDRNYILNCRLDDLMYFLETGENLNSLDLKPLSGKPVSDSTHEFDAWADRDAKRVFCHYERDTLVLNKLDKALH